VLAKNSLLFTQLATRLGLWRAGTTTLAHIDCSEIPTLGPDSERYSISERTVNTGALLIAQIHDYLLGLKSIKTLIVGIQKI
jgi:hypothetical protein